MTEATARSISCFADSRRCRISNRRTAVFHPRIHILTQQHDAIAARTARFKPGSTFPGSGISKRSHQDVPEWKVTVVVGVNIALMMDAVALRSLDEISQNPGRSNIPMLK